MTQMTGNEKLRWKAICQIVPVTDRYCMLNLDGRDKNILMSVVTTVLSSY